MIDLSPIPALHLMPSVRVDYTRDTHRTDVSPRFISRYDIVPEFPKTTLKGAIGIYTQPPQPQQSIVPFGTPGLKSSRAIHYDVGIEQDFTKQINLTLDAWYKTLTDLVSLQPSATTASGITYGNTGSGRIYGIDVWLRYKPDDHFFGWVSYTLSRSERRDFPSYPMRLAAFDQTHILAVVGSYKLGRGWQVGATFRYVTGPLYTPNLGGVSDFDAGAYQPIPSFPQYTARLPAYHELDLRVDKEWYFTSWTLGVYLDVRNVYNRQNPEAVQYNYNYSQNQPVSFLPILPILGVRGTF
jgi:outer membrane receptor protein involved in Fe transport